MDDLPVQFDDRTNDKDLTTIAGLRWLADVISAFELLFKKTPRVVVQQNLEIKSPANTGTNSVWGSNIKKNQLGLNDILEFKASGLLAANGAIKDISFQIGGSTLIDTAGGGLASSCWDFYAKVARNSSDGKWYCFARVSYYKDATHQVNLANSIVLNLNAALDQACFLYFKSSVGTLGDIVLHSFQVIYSRAYGL